MKTTLLLGVFSGLALMACLDNSVTPEYTAAKGTARFTLPAVPEAALAKSATSPIPPSYGFSVTVSGPGMQPLTRTWDAALFGGKTVTLEDIPSGTDRVFTGRLLFGGTMTHEGSTTVHIGGGQTVFVPLVLRDVRSGRAEICVEVEGWPTPKCTPIDTVPVDLTLTGCWQIEAYDEETYLSGTLSISAMEGALYATFLAANRLSYFGNPVYINGAWRVTLQPSLTDPGFGGGRVVEDVKEVEIPLTTTAKLYLPQDTLISPPDSGWYRTFQLRLDDIQPGMHAGPLSFLSGVMMDEAFMTVRGHFKGYASTCGLVVMANPDHITLGDTVWASDRPAIVQP